MKKITIYLFNILLISSIIFIPVSSKNEVYAASKICLNKTKVTIVKGRTSKLKIRGTHKKVKWQSSNKKIASVTQKGIVKGLKSGTCFIYAKVKNKKLKCTVTIITRETYNARRFYSLVRKKGKAGKNNTRILHQYLLSPSEESRNTYITAYPQYGKLCFQHTCYPNANDPIYYSIKITIDLAHDKSGSVSCYTYQADPFITETTTGIISTRYDGKKYGFSFTNMKSHYEADSIDDEDSDYDGPLPESLIPQHLKKINETFKYTNKLMKKYNYSMKKIGFIKWK